MVRSAGRAEAISPFIAMEVLERAQELERQGEHIIHLAGRTRLSHPRLRPGGGAEGPAGGAD